MDEPEKEITVPIIQEEAHADAVPVATGGVRVTKHVDTHDEVIEQTLRKSRVEVKRVKTDRVVDGPQPLRRTGKTLIIPVVSEILHIKRQWVVTEEIHITEHEESETMRETVPVLSERADIERVDSSGNVVPSEVDEAGVRTARRGIIGKKAGVESRPRRRLEHAPGILSKRNEGSE